MSTRTWTVTEAKAKFSEIVEKARVSGPQTITKNGRIAVVVVSAEEWQRKTHRPGNLAAFFAESPLRGSGLKAPAKSRNRAQSNRELPARYQRRRVKAEA
jgi:prevent-host-death family protein